MSFIYPLILILGESFGKVTDKFAFNKTSIKPSQLLFLDFLVMFFGVAILILFFNRDFPKLTIGIFLLVVIMVGVSFLQNIFYAKGIKIKELSFIESIMGIQPVIASFLAFIIFPSEREIKYVAGIVLGSIILYLGNKTKKHKIKLDKGTLFILFSILFSAVLENVYKFGLHSISPNFLFLFRIGGVLLLIIIFLKPNFKKLESKGRKIGLLSGFFYLFGSLASLYSIQYLGLNFTILMFMLTTTLIYFFSFTFLKEKFNLKRIIMSILFIILVLFITYI